MRRYRNSLLLVLLAGLSLAQDSTEVISPEVRRVGQKLACLCGTCKNTVGSCPMLQCHYSSPAREKIAAMKAAGQSDDQVVAVMVAENGKQALSQPPAEGFSLLAWIMPFAAILLGLLAIVLFVKRFHGKRAAAGLPPLDEALLDRYHDQIEKEVAKLD